MTCSGLSWSEHSPSILLAHMNNITWTCQRMGETCDNQSSFPPPRSSCCFRHQNLLLISMLSSPHTASLFAKNGYPAAHFAHSIPSVTRTISLKSKPCLDTWKKIYVEILLTGEECANEALLEDCESSFTNDVISFMGQYVPVLLPTAMKLELEVISRLLQPIHATPTLISN